MGKPLSEADARAYASEQKAEVQQEGVAVLESWPVLSSERLAVKMLEEKKE